MRKTTSRSVDKLTADSVIARLKCHVVQLHSTCSEAGDEPQGSAKVDDDTERVTTSFELVLFADGRLSTPTVGSKKGVRRQKKGQRSDVVVEGICSCDGNVTLRTVPLMTSGDIEARVLAGRFTPPCNIAGTIDGLAGDRFDITLTAISGIPDSPAADPTWARVLELLKVLRAFGRANGGAQHKGDGEDFSAYLPIEIINHICSFLSESDIIALSSCSRLFKDLCTDSWLWKRVYFSRYVRKALVRDERYAQGDPHQQTRDEPDWKHLCQQILTGDPALDQHLVIKDGSYVLEGHTRNDGPGNNITRVEGIQMLLKDGVLSAQMTYLAGSTYNRVATATWNGGYDRKSRRIWWQEKYSTHSGLFHYDGKVIDHGSINGTYYWDVNGATGTFELRLSDNL